MVTLVIVLNETDYLNEVLATLVNNNVKGATIIDSQGMGSAIVKGDYQYIPIFGSLRKLIDENHLYNKTIFSVVKEEIVEELVEAIRNLFEKKRPGIGFIFTMPVNNIYLLDK
ncbi:MAG: P-II family nitrogen regulator [Bacilli bacterium]|jgi:nitrogen regulatory protein PII|nr:hypothetical protein [Acholeplasmataceae bacterium]